jgi:hypothetical protein
MARDWVKGERGRYLSPIRVYLLASALYFVVGGDPFLSALVQSDLVELVPDSSVVGLSAEGVRSALQRQTMGWISLLRFLTLIPIGFLLAGLAPGSGPRLAPALVLTMHMYTVSFLLMVVLSLAYSLVGFEPTTTTPETFGLAHFGFERCLVGAWLIFGIRVLWRRRWLLAVSGGVVVAVVDLLLLFVAFGLGVGAMGSWLDPTLGPLEPQGARPGI